MRKIEKFCLALAFSVVMLLIGGATPVLAQPDVTLSPATGAVGDWVTIEGIGFSSNTYVIITYDGQAITAYPVPDTLSAITYSIPPQTDEFGKFSCRFQIPESAFDEHTVRVTDGLREKEARFYVDTPKIRLSTVEIAAEAPFMPKITLHADRVISGVPFSIVGTGFPSRSWVTFAFEPKVTASVTASVGGGAGGASTGCNGSFRVTVSVAVTAEAPVEVTVVATAEPAKEARTTFIVLPETVPLPPPVVIEQIPTPPSTPSYIWVIIGIGLALLIVVIVATVLIVKVR